MSNKETVKREVFVFGGVVTAIGNKYIVIMTIENRLIYHIEKSTRKDITNMNFSEGDEVWVECIPSENYVLTAYHKSSDDKPRPRKQFIEM